MAGNVREPTMKLGIYIALGACLDLFRRKRALRSPRLRFTLQLWRI